MASKRAQSADGRNWRVRRRWIPHREGKGASKRFGGKEGAKRRFDSLDFLDVGGLDFGDGIFAAIGAILIGIMIVVLLVIFVGPIALLGIDLIWLLGALLIGTFARFVLGHPWRVEAMNDDGERFDWAFQGFRTAGEGRDHIADRLRSGLDPESIAPPDAVRR